MNRVLKLLVFIFLLFVCSCRQEKTKGPDYSVMPVVDTGVEFRLYERMGIKKENLCELTKRGKEDADYNDDFNQPSYTKLYFKGKPLPDNAGKWVLIKDDITGRIWETKTDDGSIHDRDTLFTFKEAQDHVKKLNDMKYGGYSSWRMPNLKELASIVHFGKTMPSVNTLYFPYQYASFYWSATECLDDNQYAWGIIFQEGQSLSHYKRVRYFFRAVCLDKRAVDHVEKFSDQSVRFHDNDDGTITDLATGLMWQKNYASVENVKKEVSTFKWLEARVFCEESNFAGFKDWRLPNINELMSIVDYTRYDPAIYDVFGNDMKRRRFFSSTPEGRTQCPYNVYIPDGAIVISGTKASIRLVRNHDLKKGI
ncbi:Lcl C-terminal domain-containing protein [Desulfoluna spongiiphila]|uniref:Lcl C-terminal domain-containing protein n=1 Tax=Desulfoluna spongiiphila TaxID=419481 RepID=UPI001255BE7B|nr:DUF1566 domain-containing protein [Desulfoluna spongiiphila]VVS95038.1 prokaryotic membrane lipoprotein lipid attachment site profile [Desulfoluna spongiiphila]